MTQQLAFCFFSSSSSFSLVFLAKSWRADCAWDVWVLKRLCCKACTGRGRATGMAVPSFEEVWLKWGWDRQDCGKQKLSLPLRKKVQTLPRLPNSFVTKRTKRVLAAKDVQTLLKRDLILASIFEALYLTEICELYCASLDGRCLFSLFRVWVWFVWGTYMNKLWTCDPRLFGCSCTSKLVLSSCL